MLRSSQFIKENLKQLFKVPGVMETYLWIHDVLGRPPLYDCCWRYLPSWLEELNRGGRRASGTPTCRVLFFSTLFYWINYSLALSVVLAGRNVEVDFAWLLHPNVLNASPTIGNAHWRRSFAANRAHSEHPRLHLYNLEEVVPSVVTDEMREIASQQACIDVSYLSRKERVKIDSGQLDFNIFELRKKQNIDAISRVASLLGQRCYDRVIVPNGVSLDFGAVSRYVSGLGLPISTIEMWDIKGRVVVSNDSAVVKISTDNLWAQDAPHTVSSSRRKRVQQIIEKRQNPSAKYFTIRYQGAHLETPEKIRAQLRLHPNRPVVLICPNVPFDSIFYVERKKNFPAMWEWLVKTVEFLSSRTDCQVIIRSHPAEVRWKPTETTQMIIQQRFPTLPEHFIVLPPKAPVNTYSIMLVADLGIVYASTTGLEMAMRGIPVICGISNQHYNQRGFTIDPETPAEYFQQIDMILRNPKSFRLSDHQIDLAFCYADIFFNKWPVPFPWHVKTLRNDLTNWPIKRMLSDEGNSMFGHVFDRLAGI